MQAGDRDTKMSDFLLTSLSLFNDMHGKIANNAILSHKKNWKCHFFSTRRGYDVGHTNKER